MATLDEVLKDIRELTSTVAGRANDSTISWPEIEGKFTELVKEQVALQVQERLDNAPVHRIPGKAIGPDGQVYQLGDMRKNRYYPMLRDFVDGKAHKSINMTVKPVDLYLAYRMLDGQQRLKHAQISGQATPPSQDLEMAVKALTSTDAGLGAELVPNDLASQLWEDIYLGGVVVPQMMPITMPTNPFDVPLGLTDVKWRKGGQNRAVTGADPATAKSVLGATEIVTDQTWSYTLNEDAILAMASALRQRLAISAAEVLDAFALNADSTNAATGNINSDDASPEDDAYYLTDGQDGLRHLWLVDNTAQNIDAAGALTDAKITDMLATMGKYAVNPAQVRMSCDVGTYLKGFLATGAGAPGEYVATLDKIGSGAVILTGQLGAYRGIPLLVSGVYPLTAADGKADTATPGNNTKGQITAWNSLMWYYGTMRDLLIEMDRDIQLRSYLMVTSMRPAVAAHGTRSSAKHTAGIRNITV